VLALDGPDGRDDAEQSAGWPVTFSNPGNRRRKLAFLGLANRAMSGSGVQKGRHIIDPRTGRPIKGTNAAWICAGDAATADALSTAFMVMSPKEVERYCRRNSDVLAMIVVAQADGGRVREKVLHFGPWREDQLLVDGESIGDGDGPQGN
jgi:thiamine biosynthesis lipoprotein